MRGPPPSRRRCPPPPRPGRRGGTRGWETQPKPPRAVPATIKKIGARKWARKQSQSPRECVFKKSQQASLRGWLLCLGPGAHLAGARLQPSVPARPAAGSGGLRGPGLRGPRLCPCGHGSVGPQPAPAKPGSDLVPSKRASLPQLPCRSFSGWGCGGGRLLPAFVSFFFPAHFQKGPRDI